MRRIKEIPKKNYRIYFFIVFITLFLSISSYIIYNNHKNYENSIPILRGNASEIEPKDLDEYLRENDKAILYFGVATDENSRNVETDLIDLINKKNLDVVYVNLTDTVNLKEFFDDFNMKYSDGLQLSNYPAFVLMVNQKIFDIRQRNNRELFITDIEQLIDIYEIRGEKHD